MKLILHGHHADNVINVLPSMEERIKDIKANKPKEEHETRLSLIRELTKDEIALLPKNIIATYADYNHAYAEWKRAYAARKRADVKSHHAYAEWKRAYADYNRADAARKRADADYDRADADYDRAYADYDRAYADYDRAYADYDRAYADYNRADAARKRADAELSLAIGNNEPALIDWHKKACGCPFYENGKNIFSP